MIRGLVVSLVANLVSLLGIAVMPAPPFQYLFIGQRGVAAVAVAIGLGSIWRSVGRRVEASYSLGALALVSIALSLVLLSSQWTADVPTPAYQGAVDAISRGIEDDIHRLGLPGPVEVGAQVGWVPMATYTGVRLQIERSGTETLDGGSWSLPDVPPPDSGGTPQYAVVTPDGAAAMAALGWTTVATYQPFSAEEQTRMGELQRQLDELVAELTTGPGMDGQEARKVRLRRQIDDLTDGRVAAAAVRGDDPGA